MATTAARMQQRVTRTFTAEFNESDATFATSEVAAWVAKDTGGTLFGRTRVGFADGSVLVVSVKPTRPYNAGTYNVRARAFTCSW